MDLDGKITTFTFSMFGQNAVEIKYAHKLVLLTPSWSLPPSLSIFKTIDIFQSVRKSREVLSSMKAAEYVNVTL